MSLRAKRIRAGFDMPALVAYRMSLGRPISSTKTRPSV